MSPYNIANDDFVFAARLTPYRSLGRKGFIWVMGSIGAICFTIGIVFLLHGLWPVLGFMGLDVALIYWAFKANYRSAKSYEDVEVSRSHVLLRKVNPKGILSSHMFDQYGTRFEVERHDEIGITKMLLRNRNRFVEFGAFLNPHDRESFAEAFSRALWRAKK